MFEADIPETDPRNMSTKRASTSGRDLNAHSNPNQAHHRIDRYTLQMKNGNPPTLNNPYFGVILAMN